MICEIESKNSVSVSTINGAKTNKILSEFKGHEEERRNGGNNLNKRDNRVMTTATAEPRESKIQSKNHRITNTLPDLKQRAEIRVRSYQPLHLRGCGNDNNHTSHN